MAGIAQHYQPDELVGKQIVVVLTSNQLKSGSCLRGHAPNSFHHDNLSLVTIEKICQRGRVIVLGGG